MLHLELDFETVRYAFLDCDDVIFILELSQIFLGIQHNFNIWSTVKTLTLKGAEPLIEPSRTRTTQVFEMLKFTFPRPPMKVKPRQPFLGRPHW